MSYGNLIVRQNQPLNVKNPHKKYKWSHKSFPNRTSWCKQAFTKKTESKTIQAEVIANNVGAEENNNMEVGDGAAPSVNKENDSKDGEGTGTSVNKENDWMKVLVQHQHLTWKITQKKVWLQHHQ